MKANHKPGREWKRSDINDLMVCQAYWDMWAFKNLTPQFTIRRWPYDILMDRSRCPFKVAYAAMERACANGLIDYGVSLSSGWLTDKGKELAQQAGYIQGLTAGQGDDTIVPTSSSGTGTNKDEVNL